MVIYRCMTWSNGFQVTSMNVNYQKLKFHHIGYACSNINLYKKRFDPLTKKKFDLIFDDINQNVRVAFLTISSELKLEFIEILDKSKYCPIKNFLNKNISGYHHICFETKDLEFTIKDLKNNGYRLISKTENGFENRKINFFVPKSSPDGPLLEIVTTKD